MRLLAAVLLLTLGSQGKVSENFKDCKQFFQNKEPPTFNGKLVPGRDPERYQQICQMHDGRSFYATLYDTKEKIPVYSAYTYQKGELPLRNNFNWKTEPELKGVGTGSKKEKLGDLQAVNADYEKSGYDKGHLYPVCHTRTEDEMKSTFTLTNAAPQTHDFNVKWFRCAEAEVIKELDDCLNIGGGVGGGDGGGAAHVITGVVASSGKGRVTLKDEGRVNVPTHFWTAFYCGNSRKSVISQGYIMDYPGLRCSLLSPSDLERKLSKLYNFEVAVFKMSKSSGSSEKM